MVDYITEQYKSIGLNSLSEAFEMSRLPMYSLERREGKREGVMLGMGIGVEEIEAA